MIDTDATTIATNHTAGPPTPFPHAPCPLLIIGDYGRGKTTLMKKLLMDALNAGLAIFDANLTDDGTAQGGR